MGGVCGVRHLVVAYGGLVVAYGGLVMAYGVWL